MRIHKLHITLLCVVGFLSSFVSAVLAQATPHDYSREISLAVDRWLVVQKPSGFLPYGFNFLEDKESEPDSMSAANLARQAGTAAVLADYYAFTKDPRARPALEKFLTAFGRHSLPIGKGLTQKLIEKTRILSIPVGRGKIHNALEWLDVLFVKEGPGRVLSPDKDYNGAFAGTVALALLTELRFAQTSQDESFSHLRQAWLEGLMTLRIPGGGFRKFPTSIDPTPYSDGEAWLALAESHGWSTAALRKAMEPVRPEAEPAPFDLDKRRKEWRRFEGTVSAVMQGDPDARQEALDWITKMRKVLDDVEAWLR